MPVTETLPRTLPTTRLHHWSRIPYDDFTLLPHAADYTTTGAVNSDCIIYMAKLSCSSCKLFLSFSNHLFIGFAQHRIRWSCVTIMLILFSFPSKFLLAALFQLIWKLTSQWKLFGKLWGYFLKIAVVSGSVAICAHEYTQIDLRPFEIIYKVKAYTWLYTATHNQITLLKLEETNIIPPWNVVTSFDYTAHKTKYTFWRCTCYMMPKHTCNIICILSIINKLRTSLLFLLTITEHKK